RQPAVLLTGLLDRHVVFFGGKGGVGKTTCSSAFALAASRRGQRVFLYPPIRRTRPRTSSSGPSDRPNANCRRDSPRSKSTDRKKPAVISTVSSATSRRCSARM